MIDIKDPAKPYLISVFPRPEPPKGAPYADFCDKGGRFGPHNISQAIDSPDVQKPGDMMYVPWFNAGLRVVDIRDPFAPKEVAHFVPAAPEGSPAGAIQINDVYVDENEIVYAVDRFAGGLYVLETTL